MEPGVAIDNRTKALLAVLFAGLVLLYMTVVPRMVSDWLRDPNFSHGFIVPVFSAYVIWGRRSEMRLFPAGDSALPGILLLLAGMFLLILGKAGVEYFTMRVSMVFAIGGLFRILFGRIGFRKCLFPLAFLFFMVPIPSIVYDAIGFPLKMLASRLGEQELAAAGIPVLREGNIIHLPNIQLEVADACSGIRSLMSLVALSAAIAYVLGLGPATGAALLASAVPISVVTNSLRIFLTGVLSNRFGQRAAEGFFHEFSGWLVFVASAMLVFAIGMALRRWTAGAKRQST